MTTIAVLTPEDVEAIARTAAEATAKAIAARFDLVPIPEWQTAQEMARRLGVTDKTIRNRAERGAIECREIGGKLMYRARP